MATLGEVLWASQLKLAGVDRPMLVSFNGDVATLRARTADSNWIVIFQKDVFSFRLKDFSVTSTVRKTPKLQLEFAQYRKGNSPVLMTLKVIWPCRFIFLDRFRLWECKFLYDPKLIRFKILPQGNVLDPTAKEQLGPVRQLKKYLPLTKLYRVADMASGSRGRVNRRRRQRNIRHVKASVRPNPEVRTASLAAFRETQASPYAQFGVDVSEVYRRNHSGLNRTPGFALLPKSKLPINGHTAELFITDNGRSLDFRTNDAKTTWSNSVRAFSFIFPVPAPPAFGLNPNVRNRAIKKLQESSNQGVSNIAVDVIQFRQFNSLVANTAARVVNSVRALRRGNLVGATDALIAGRNIHNSYGGRLSKSKTLAQNWLELQYGWKPLLADIVEGREALRQFALKKQLVQVVRSSAIEEIRYKGDIRDATIGLISPPRRFGRWETNYITQYKFALRFTASDHLKTLLQQTGFNNPISAGWELLPFSFVADWFIPIGPYLECLSANQGLTFLDGSETLFVKREHLASISFSGQLEGLTAANNRNVRLAGTYSQTWIYHNRAKLNTFPGVTFPTFKNPLSVTHALNGIALLRSLFV